MDLNAIFRHRHHQPLDQKLVFSTPQTNIFAFEQDPYSPNYDVSIDGDGALLFPQDNEWKNVDNYVGSPKKNIFNDINANCDVQNDKNPIQMPLRHLENNLEEEKSEFKFVDKESKSLKRWTLEEKQNLIQLAEVMMNEGEFCGSDLAHLYTQMYPGRTLKAVLKKITLLFDNGDIGTPSVSKSAPWSFEEIEALKSILKYGKGLKKAEIINIFQKQNIGPKRSESAISHQLWKLHR